MRRRDERYKATAEAGIVPSALRAIRSELRMEQALAAGAMQQKKGYHVPMPREMYGKVKCSLREMRDEWLCEGLPAITFPAFFYEVARADRQAATLAAQAAEAAAAKAACAAKAYEAAQACLDTSLPTQHGFLAPECQLDPACGVPMQSVRAVGEVADMDELDCEPHACRLLLCGPEVPQDQLSMETATVQQAGKRRRSASPELEGLKKAAYEAGHGWQMQEG